MCCAIKLFRDIKADVVGGFAPDVRANDHHTRVTSIILRIFGTMLAFYAGISLLSGVSLLLTGSPLMAISSLIVAAFKAIIAHDLIKIGYNQRALFTGEVRPLIEHVVHDVVAAGVFGGPPAIIKGTWIAAPMYKCATGYFRSALGA